MTKLTVKMVDHAGSVNAVRPGDVVLALVGSTPLGPLDSLIGGTITESSSAFGIARLRWTDTRGHAHRDHFPNGVGLVVERA